MDLEQLNKLGKELGISADKIIREEAEMFFLNKLANSKIGNKVVFYGGTALRLVYNSPRFSEDINLLQIKAITMNEFEEFLKSAIKENANWKLKDIKDKRNTVFALILVNDDKLKQSFSVKVEVHKPPKPMAIETELSIIKSPTSILSPLLLVPTLPELKKLKENALIGRQKARDIFDLWYISKSLRENFVLPDKIPSFSERDFKNELQVFLPRQYYLVIKQLYDKINSKIK